MKANLIFMLLILFSSSSFAETKYTNAKIERVEVCKTNSGSVYIFFEYISGTQPPMSNGCSNDVALPYIQLNSTNGSLTPFEEGMLSVALAAQMADKDVRVRYDNQTNLLFSIAVK